MKFSRRIIIVPAFLLLIFLPGAVMVKNTRFLRRKLFWPDCEEASCEGLCRTQIKSGPSVPCRLLRSYCLNRADMTCACLYRSTRSLFRFNPTSCLKPIHFLGVDKKLDRDDGNN
ncbi:hypothetical protein KSP39_PZI012425 [Platanthera zijinensis]|uniref:Uncharacterized protein n=1 Tax=Platanthera zijinensis TaxID=2320716 RepID=A0AAP0BF51_9ASPA